MEVFSQSDGQAESFECLRTHVVHPGARIEITELGSKFESSSPYRCDKNPARHGRFGPASCRRRCDVLPVCGVPEAVAVGPNETTCDV